MSGASASSNSEPHFLWHLLKCVAFQVGQAVGFSIQQPPFPDGTCHRGSKAWADAPSLRIPGIYAGLIGWARSTLFYVVFVEAEECIQVNQFKVERASGDDDAANFESAGDSLEWIVFQPEGGPECLQLLGGHEEFGGDLVAEAFGPDFWRQQSVEKGQAGFAGEDVGDFVDEGETLEFGGVELGVVLLPTMPLKTTRTPIWSNWLRRWLRATFPVEFFAAQPVSRLSTARMATETLVWSSLGL